MPRIVATSELPLVAGTVRRLRGPPDPAALAPVAPRAVERVAKPSHDEAQGCEDAVEHDGQDDAAVHLAHHRRGAHPHPLHGPEDTRRDDRRHDEEHTDGPEDERRRVVAAPTAQHAEREEDAAHREPEAPELDRGEYLHGSVAQKSV